MLRVGVSPNPLSRLKGELRGGREKSAPRMRRYIRTGKAGVPGSRGSWHVRPSQGLSNAGDPLMHLSLSEGDMRGGAQAQRPSMPPKGRAGRRSVGVCSSAVGVHGGVPRVVWGMYP